jgi:acetolactate synthase-1/2/3 large subunit
MHFVAALDSEPKMRAVLALFEGVATGAADGYARMAGKPAATLLHLGCGLGNGLANLHNARKGKVPVVNIVGDHATTTRKYDAQLQSDIETVARNVSPGFVRTSQSTAALCQDAADAITAARGLPGQVATLILPADVSVGRRRRALPPPPPPSRRRRTTPPCRPLPKPGPGNDTGRTGGGKAPCCWADRRCASPACWRPRASPRTAA